MISWTSHLIMWPKSKQRPLILPYCSVFVYISICVNCCPSRQSGPALPALSSTSLLVRAVKSVPRPDPTRRCSRYQAKPRVCSVAPGRVPEWPLSLSKERGRREDRGERALSGSWLLVIPVGSGRPPRPHINTHTHTHKRRVKICHVHVDLLLTQRLWSALRVLRQLASCWGRLKHCSITQRGGGGRRLRLKTTNCWQRAEFGLTSLLFISHRVWGVNSTHGLIFIFDAVWSFACLRQMRGLWWLGAAPCFACERATCWHPY